MAPFVSEEDDSTGAELEDVHLMNDELKQHLRRQQAHLHRYAIQKEIAEIAAWAGPRAQVRQERQERGCRKLLLKWAVLRALPRQAHLHNCARCCSVAVAGAPGYSWHRQQVHLHSCFGAQQRISISSCRAETESAHAC